jgi:hypothetical protein
MDRLINTIVKLAIFKSDFDYHLMRASMVFIAFFFGYQKWFQYEADALIPYISHGPLIFWVYTVFGIRGATYFLGAAEYLFGVLLFLDFWNKKLGILGALRFLLLDDLDLYDHPIHSGWLGGLCRRLPGYDRESCIPDEGSRDFGCIFLLAEGGCGQGVGLSTTSARREKAGGVTRAKEPPEEGEQTPPNTWLSERKGRPCNSSRVFSRAIASFRQWLATVDF